MGLCSSQRLTLVRLFIHPVRLFPDGRVEELLGKFIPNCQALEKVAGRGLTEIDFISHILLLCNSLYFV